MARGVFQKPLFLIASDFALTVVAASEIEFYLHGSYGSPALEAWQTDVAQRCAAEGVAIHRIEKERGLDQHEISLSPSDVETMVSSTLALKRIVSECATAHGFTADFGAKPKADQPGSGLHIHLHLEDESGTNLFFKNDAQISQALQFSIGGMLAWIADSMPVFAPSEASYTRFAKGSNAPTTVSWGANNRTVAIRLPDKAHNKKHIEHRVAGADAAPARVAAVILAAVHDGLKEQIMPSCPQIYGDASLEQYNLPLIPNTLELALANMRRSQHIARYFSAEALWPVS